jgi:hypothetical protein
MRALSFLFAALLGIALALIAPALAGPANSSSATAMEAVTSTAVAAVEIPAEPSDAAVAIEVDQVLDASLMVELGLDAVQPGDAA